MKDANHKIITIRRVRYYRMDGVTLPGRVRLRWQEKYIVYPENGLPDMSPTKWRTRQMTMRMDEFKQHYMEQPPR